MPYVPLSRPSGARNRPPWITQSIQRLRRIKLRKWKINHQVHTPESYADYVTARNHAQAALRQSRLAYERGLVENSKNDVNRLFAYINRRNRYKPGIPSLKLDNGTLVTNDEDKFETLLEIYKTYFVDRTIKPAKVEPQSTSAVLTSISFDPLEVVQLLRNIKVTKVTI